MTPEDPKNESGLIQMIRMGKYIRHKWVNGTETRQGRSEIAIKRLNYMGSENKRHSSAYCSDAC